MEHQETQISRDVAPEGLHVLPKCGLCATDYVMYNYTKAGGNNRQSQSNVLADLQQPIMCDSYPCFTSA